jgi:hypothetical protein
MHVYSGKGEFYFLFILKINIKNIFARRLMNGDIFFVFPDISFNIFEFLTVCENSVLILVLKVHYHQLMEIMFRSIHFNR